MPHKLLERQYQLQAQRRHEEHLRQDYYRQTARYFEREAAAARQFNSWSTKGPECYSDRLEKLRKAERLEGRRERLRRLLAEESESHARLAEERRVSRRRSSETVSLDELRQKLVERRAEQSLYYPNACRRLRSYAFSPTDAARKLESLDISSNGCASVVSSLGRFSHSHKRFSTSPSLEKALYYDYEENNSNSRNKKSSTTSDRYHAESPKSSKMSESGNSTNLRFAARGNHQSLCETNLRTDRRQNDHLNSSITQKDDNAYLFPSEKQRDQLNKSNQLIEEQKDYNGNDSLEVQEDDAVEPKLSGLSNGVDGSPNGSLDNERPMSECIEEEEAEQSAEKFLQNTDSLPPAFVRHTENDKTDCGNEEEDMDRHRRGNMRQKEADVAGEVDISVQMYRYLKHNDLKRQILDLARRERTFVIKHSFDEALRLRDMRNELILLQIKNLYGNQDLKMDEETRGAGLKIIEARKKLNEERMKMRYSILYSDEAKDLWKRWVREDDMISNMETNTMQDLMLQELEVEWQNLALRDKNRISQLYEKVMTRSDLQDEHKLAAVIRAANDSQKQYMNYLGE